MAAMANLVFYDGDLTTPVPHTLLPISVEKNGNRAVALWREDLSGVPVDAQVRATFSLEKLKSGIYAAEYTMVFPVQEVVVGSNSSGYSATPKVAFEDKIVVRQYIHPRSTGASRARVKGAARNLLGNVTGTTPAITAGPVADLFDRLVFPT